MAKTSLADLILDYIQQAIHLLIVRFAADMYIIYIYIYSGFNPLEEYRANRTLDNARRVINSYANEIIDKFNEWQNKQFAIESKAAYNEVEHKKYDFEEISKIINSAKKIGNYRVTSTAIGPYKKSALIKGAYNSRNHGTRYSNRASLVITAVMAYVDKVLTEQKLVDYFN